MKTSVIDVHDLLSALSVLGVEKRIGKVPGVYSVTVNFAAGTATVRYDETRVETADIKVAMHRSSGGRHSKHTVKHKAAHTDDVEPAPAPAVVHAQPDNGASVAPPPSPVVAAPKAAPLATPVVPVVTTKEGDPKPEAKPSTPVAPIAAAPKAAPAAPPVVPVVTTKEDVKPDAKPSTPVAADPKAAPAGTSAIPIVTTKEGDPKPEAKPSTPVAPIAAAPKAAPAAPPVVPVVTTKEDVKPDAKPSTPVAADPKSAPAGTSAIPVATTKDGDPKPEAKPSTPLAADPKTAPAKPVAVAAADDKAVEGKEGEAALDAHALTLEAVTSALGANTAQGLSAAEAATRLKKHGPNKLTEEKKRGWPLILLGQFKSPIVLLLVVAATLSFVFKEWLDGSAIIAVLLINGVIGFFMEWQADRAMNSLKKLASVPAKVVRDGQTIEIDRSEVVPGDVIFLEAGDMVPADARLSDAVQVQVDESALTGESVPVEKQLEPVEAKAVLAERTSMVYNATFLTKGNAHAVVVATGMNTELGRIAHLVQSADQAATPLEKRLEQFSRKLIYLTLGLVALIFIAGLINEQPWLQMLETSIALAVAAVPEGLPIVTTMALAQGMLRMARQQVIIKRLSAVETLGSTDVICTDKTGTLTENKISVVSIVTPLGTVDATLSSATTDDRAVAFVRAVAINCNTATLAAGDPLEVGLLQFALREGENLEAIRASTPKLKEEPFSSETRIMATLHRTEQGFIVYAKGAAEELLAQCTHQVSGDGEAELDDAGRSEWARRSEALAATGLKVIGAAYRTSDREDVDLTHELVFAGSIGLMDPPRPEVAPAIAECRKAGIRVVMITGDHPATALNIALKLGIGAEGDTTVVNGRDLPALAGMSADVKEKVANSNVFARVSPQQKLDLVTLLQERGHVLGMTGDGLNDAPALKKSDIGIAMGIRGTQVSQDVADIVLKDDKFTSVVLAIRQGRAIFTNIRNVVIYLLSCNLSELLVIALASVLGLHFQLVTLQILFINLVTDVLPALALGVIGADAGIMDRPPRKTDEPMVDRKRWIMIISYAVILGIGAFGAVLISHYTMHTTEDWNPQLCNNILFYTLIVAQLLHVLNMGASGVPFFRTAVVRDRRIWAALAGCAVILVVLNQIPVVREALHIQPLSLYDWSLIASCALASFLLVRASRKFILDRL